MAELIHEHESYQIMGVGFEVYKAIGRGFLEPVYQECLEIELSDRGIPFLAQHELRIVYKGRTLEQTYKPDFVCFEKIIIEAKAVTQFDDAHRTRRLAVCSGPYGRCRVADRASFA